MNILYLSQARLPSSAANSVHVMHMCEALTDLGNQVTLVGYRGSHEECFDYYGCEASFQLERFNVSNRTGESVWLALLCLKLLQRRRREFDLLYSRSAIALNACLHFGIPFIYELHSSPRTRFHRLMEQRIFRDASLKRVVFITDALKKYYLKQFPELEQQKTLVLADGAKPSHSAVNPIRLPGNNLNKVGYLGHLYPGKGGELIIGLASAMPEVDFHLVGGRQQDIDRLKCSTTSSNVFFHGHVPRSATPNYLVAFDACLAPYSSTVNLANTSADIGQWMSPLKLFEYMAAKKPIICSDLPVLKEVMADGVNGLLATCGDVESWKNALHRLLTDNELSSRLSTNAHRDLIEKHTWHRRARIINETIKN